MNYITEIIINVDKCIILFEDDNINQQKLTFSYSKWNIHIKTKHFINYIEKEDNENNLYIYLDEYDDAIEVYTDKGYTHYNKKDNFKFIVNHHDIKIKDYRELPNDWQKTEPLGNLINCKYLDENNGCSNDDVDSLECLERYGKSCNEKKEYTIEELIK